MKCSWHLCDNELTGRQALYCSKNCKSKAAVSRHRRSYKEALVEMHGGRCVDCGFEGPPFMFDFDHRDPEQKLFALSGQMTNWTKAERDAEAEKCDLVCANCHRRRTHLQRCPGCVYCSS